MSTAWWSTIDLFKKIFWLLAIPSSLAFIIQPVSTFAGGDVDMDIDTEIEGDTGVGFQFFTHKNLIAFFTIFSWTGLGCIDSGYSQFATLAISVLAGLAMMLVMASRLTESVTLNLKIMLGSEGEVYLTIPANKGGYGKIQIKIEGALRELDAVSKDSQKLKTGTIVKVRTNNILTVTQI
jgi:hypothetical protein